jgi:hypothetical protein
MIKKGRVFAILFLLFVQAGQAELSSLSHLYSLGKTIQDLDGDGLGERIFLSIIIPDNPTAGELALASDIAARANLESLAQDFALVRHESEVERWESLPNPILIGSNLHWTRDIAKDRRIDIVQLGPAKGRVFVFSHKNQRGIACVAGSDEGLLRTGRAFFLRWPYFWEIWGRDAGATYLSLENDLAKFLGQEEVLLQKTIVREALYEFPPAGSARGALKNLSFTSGEIKDLVVEIHFTDEGDQKKAHKALDLLKRQRSKGLRSAVLSYPGCAQITFELWYGKKNLQLVLPRLGSSKRLLTPPFKEIARIDGEARDFDLLNLFSTRGLYNDRDGDGILDGLETSVIIPEGLNCKGLAGLASKLVLPSAGASFPIVYLDSEIEQQGKRLVAPILVGPNGLSLDLMKTGKLKIPALENAWGLVQVVPNAFNKSGALVIHSPDTLGLEKTLAYVAESFPYFDDYAAGQPQIKDVPEDFERFLDGEKGSAEAYFDGRLRKLAEEIKDRDLETFEVRFTLPRENKPFEDAAKKSMESSLNAQSFSFRTQTLRESKKIFEKDKEFPWEGDDAIALLQDALKKTADVKPVKISLGVSESPEVRQGLKKRIEQVLAENNLVGSEVEVLSAYKQGFFWLTERVQTSLKNKGVHHMTIRFTAEEDPRNALKRSYSEPYRWLQELYPADEILAKELQIPLERIEFEIKPAGGPIYAALAFDEKGAILFQQSFSPRTKEIPFLNVLPEWGRSRITTGWLKVEAGKETALDIDLQTDLERFWEFYQEEVLKPVYSHILAKTGYEPTFAKQPYFKRLLVELWASEPDYRIGLDEEMVSSLEAMHDEIYFDTLDFLRGITRFDEGSDTLPEDTSFSSAPGNVLPLVHRSSEGGKARTKVTFEDWPALSPEMEVKWKEKGREEFVRKFAFPTLKAKVLKVPAFIYNGQEDRMETLFLETGIEKEADYLTLLDILDSYRKLTDKGLVADPFNYPKLRALTARIRWQDLEKDESLPVVFQSQEEKTVLPPPRPEEVLVPTSETISPEMCLDIVDRLGRFKTVRAYMGGRSYEGRPVPVLEVFTPVEKYVSTARLITFKPTLQLSSRQHANEISSTNYTLRLAELLARDRAYQDAVRKINFVIQPMENPDGAALAFELAKLAPFHSLHAGRYSSLGVDIGAPLNSARPILPEATVRSSLYAKWLPDIYLNLHGYPSHEWVQPFSNYSPYLFRDYWIPRGWFAYYKTLSLPIYGKWKEAGAELMSFITQEIQADERIRESNKRFYDRYNRWAARWQPHLEALELYDGVNLYAKRQSSEENRLTFRSQITFVEQTPELMDETASGAWLSFLCEQGLVYLRAHIKYLSQVKFETSRIEEEVRERVRIEFHRSRPGQVPKTK